MLVGDAVPDLRGIYSPAEVWLNLEMFCKVFFLIDFGSPESTLSESAGCKTGTLERFEKFKMASKMADATDKLS